MIFPLCRPWALSCLLDNLAHTILRTDARIQRYAGPICRWHDDVSDRAWIVDLHYAQNATELREAIAWVTANRTKRAATVARAKQIRKAAR